MTTPAQCFENTSTSKIVHTHISHLLRFFLPLYTMIFHTHTKQAAAAAVEREIFLLFFGLCVQPHSSSSREILSTPRTALSSSVNIPLYIKFCALLFHTTIEESELNCWEENGMKQHKYTIFYQFITNPGILSEFCLLLLSFEEIRRERDGVGGCMKSS